MSSLFGPAVEEAFKGSSPMPSPPWEYRAKDQTWRCTDCSKVVSHTLVMSHYAPDAALHNDSCGYLHGGTLKASLVSESQHDVDMRLHQQLQNLIIALVRELGGDYTISDEDLLDAERFDLHFVKEAYVSMNSESGVRLRIIGKG